MNYTKLFQLKKPVPIPYLKWEGWQITQTALISPEGKEYTPSSIQLLEWKAAFYDRGNRRKVIFEIDAHLAQEK